MITPSRGIEPLSQAPQACVLSIERRGQKASFLRNYFIIELSCCIWQSFYKSNPQHSSRKSTLKNQLYAQFDLMQGFSVPFLVGIEKSHV